MNTMTVTTEDVISTPKFADMVGVARASLQTWVEQGKVPYERAISYPDGKRKRYLLSRQLAEDVATYDWPEALRLYHDRKGQSA